MSKSWEQILGGYATDTLTEEEKRQLFEAALHDQALFDALADEEALKALLADPDARQQILESLLAVEKSHGSAMPHGAKLRWFGKPSSLVWAGSIAAAGLALIFGWQMDQEWGPMIQQEMEAERSVSDDKEREKDEMAFRSQPAPLEDRKLTAALEKKDESPSPSEVQPQAAIGTLSEADTDIAKSVNRLGQVQEVLKKERRVKEEGPESSSTRMQEEPSQAPGQLVDQEQTEVESAVEPLAMPDEAEVVKPAAAKLAPARERIAGQTAKEEPSSPPGALDRFYTGFGAGNLDGQAAQVDADNLTFEKSSSDRSLPKAKEEKSLSIQGEIIGGEAVIRRAKGIRYSFIRETGNVEEELAEGHQITGDWRNVRLVIEPNEDGFLYVFAPVGRGKWQQLSRMTAVKQQDNSAGGNVKAYQVVEFRMGVITNRFGKLVISSITVLFSPTPLASVTKWRSGRVNMSELQIERTDDSVYVVRPGVDSDVPLRVDITLEE